MPVAAPIAFTLDPATDELVRTLAARQQRSADGLIREAVEQYVKRAEHRADAATAWDAYQATGLHVTAEEADAWLAKLEAGEDAAPPACHA